LIIVHVEELQNSYKVKFPYNAQAVEKIKVIPGRQFRKDLGNAWLVPKTSRRALERFLEWASGKATLKEIQRPYVDPATVYPACTNTEIPIWAHQLGAFRYLWNAEAALIELKPGSGKSRVFVDYVCNHPDVKKALILCPKSFVQGWRGQFEKHAGKPVVIACLDSTAGTVSKRVQVGKCALADAALSNLPAVIVVNYDVIWREAEALEESMADWLIDAQFDVVAADEIQFLRTQSNRSKYAYRLGASIPVRIGLSGTPFPEDAVDDPFGTYRFLEPTIFGTNRAKHRSRYAVMGGYGGYQKVALINQKELRAKIDTIRFTATPEGYELPDAHDIVVTLVLPEDAQKLYRKLERDLYAKVGTGEVTLANAAVAFTRLQALASGYLPFEDEVTGERTVKQLHTAKQDALQDILESLPSDTSVVVVSRFHKDLEATHVAAKAVGRESAEISGRPGHPEAHIDKGVWVGPETVLAVQAQSGVEGLDLTRAHYCIFYSYTLELGKYTQACARIRRAGQTEKCTYYHLIVQGSVDQRIQQLLAKKQHVLKGLLEDTP
jgi:SNF2 family DNA or RNA helicase